jgi:hypothetical protein
VPRWTVHQSLNLSMKLEEQLFLLAHSFVLSNFRRRAVLSEYNSRSSALLTRHSLMRGE